MAARTLGYTLVLGLSAATAAQPDPSGIEFVTVGSPGNVPVDASFVPPDENPRVIGRGGVGYEYRIGKYEVTTAQWAEFFNAAFDRPQADWIPHLIPPTFWGAVGTTPNTPGGRRWTVPAGREMRPTGNISWRMAAIYCNWLENNKSTDREAFLDGAYDVSTFGFGPVFGFSDQLTHHAGSRYWIPTWDEWLKAAHYDPDKANPDGSRGGWWHYGNGSDTRTPYGPPGLRVRASGFPAPDPNGPLAEANAGWESLDFPGYSPFTVSLGAYDVQSPFGLRDVAGGTTEWTEEVLRTNGIWPQSRFLDGSSWGSGGLGLDDIWQRGGEFPSVTFYNFGFRIASSVPSPSTCVLGLTFGMLATAQRRRRTGGHDEANPDAVRVRTLPAADGR